MNKQNLNKLQDDIEKEYKKKDKKKKKTMKVSGSKARNLQKIIKDKI